MNEYLNESLKDLSFYFIILKFILYFTIGAILLVVLNKILRMFSLIFSKLSKEKLVDKLMFIFKLIIFILASTLIGWCVIYFIF